MIFNISGKKEDKTDEELLREFTENSDLEVLGELYSGYMHLVYGVCLKYLRNREEAMDAVMQIFEKLIIEIPKQDIGNFKSWLHVVSKNFCLMKLRSDKSRYEKYNEWANETAIFMENSLPAHPIDEDKHDMEDKLSKCIDRLKEEQKECINLFYYENRCYNDIARLLGLSDKKVKSLLQNAKRNIKICLEEKNVKEEF